MLALSQLSLLVVDVLTVTLSTNQGFLQALLEGESPPLKLTTSPQKNNNKFVAVSTCRFAHTHPSLSTPKPAGNFAKHYHNRPTF